MIHATQTRNTERAFSEGSFVAFSSEIFDPSDDEPDKNKKYDRDKNISEKERQPFIKYHPL